MDRATTSCLLVVISHPIRPGGRTSIVLCGTAGRNYVYRIYLACVCINEYFEVVDIAGTRVTS